MATGPAVPPRRPGHDAPVRLPVAGTEAGVAGRRLRDRHAHRSGEGPGAGAGAPGAGGGAGRPARSRSARYPYRIVARRGAGGRAARWPAAALLLYARWRPVAGGRVLPRSGGRGCDGGGGSGRLGGRGARLPRTGNAGAPARHGARRTHRRFRHGLDRARGASEVARRGPGRMAGAQPGVGIDADARTARGAGRHHRLRHGHDHGRLPGGPHDAHVVGAAVGARPGLVAHLPVVGHAGADAGVARGVADQPVAQGLALVHRERWPQRHALQRFHHGQRRGGVARVAGYGRVQFRLPAVEPERLVADGPRKRRHAGRAAQLFHQEVGGRIVAVLHRGRAQFAHRHAVGQVLLRDRRIRHQVGLAVPDAFIEQRRLVLQDGRRQHGLEGAAQREALVAAMDQEAAVGRIDCRHAQPPARIGFQPRQLRGGRQHRGCRRLVEDFYGAGQRCSGTRRGGQRQQHAAAGTETGHGDGRQSEWKCTGMIPAPACGRCADERNCAHRKRGRRYTGPHDVTRTDITAGSDRGRRPHRAGACPVAGAARRGRAHRRPGQRPGTDLARHGGPRPHAGVLPPAGLCAAGDRRGHPHRRAAPARGRGGSGVEYGARQFRTGCMGRARHAAAPGRTDPRQLRLPVRLRRRPQHHPACAGHRLPRRDVRPCILCGGRAHDGRQPRPGRPRGRQHLCADAARARHRHAAPDRHRPAVRQSGPRVRGPAARARSAAGHHGGPGELVFHVPRAPPRGRAVPARPVLAGRRRRPRAQSRRRPGHEHRHRRRRQPGLEAGAGAAGPRPARAAGHVRGRTDRLCPHAGGHHRPRLPAAGGAGGARRDPAPLAGAARAARAGRLRRRAPRPVQNPARVWRGDTATGGAGAAAAPAAARLAVERGGGTRGPAAGRSLPGAARHARGAGPAAPGNRRAARPPDALRPALRGRCQPRRTAAFMTATPLLSTLIPP
uniref:Uncharacterized protein n=1 Tax=Tanacetum cinerariifolium TaxID=118510 RepID=A0A699GEL9_TANCI|nr:hypothetical protein [Tanacetum cinerariifolium]